jgi:uncharacterized protein
VAPDNAEPSMEEILASIRKIISEEQDTAPKPAPAVAAVADAEPEPTPVVKAKPAKAPVIAAPPPEPEPEHEVFELTEMVEAVQASVDAPLDDDDFELAPLDEEQLLTATTDAIVSDQTVAVTQASISSLSNLMVRGYSGSQNTLEGVVREMLRPLLKEWLDKNLPDMVEKMVAREIGRITGRG